MKFKLLLLFLFAASINNMSAQDARAILDKASDAYNKAGGVTANFTFDTKDAKASATYSYDGKAYMKGNKFKIEIPDGITWFDGKTQWVYVKDTEEVNISNPSGDELQGISPSALFNIYKTGFNLVYKGEKKVNAKSVLEVEMTPTKKGSDVTKIIVQIDKATSIFSKITIIDKSGMQNILSIKNYQTGVNLADTMFSFDKKDYPRAEIVDLR
ncbi:LolA family protein [Dysgonomonas sp. ZJ279]|uniref:LolA family protein n=1 Tax=Dysgonomonas sp. ZJ279 TaxID=2709796 RepID=UPI0013EBB6CD|nr:LolA-like putative outer membrane lipoprotein chaperone [Dysgonomonas sp. ZJ279]